MAIDFKAGFSAAKEMAAGTFKNAKKKAEDVAAVAKANLAIHKEQENIKKAQQELGEMYYQDYVSDSPLKLSDYEEVCRRIDESKRKIAELKESVGIKEAERANEVIVDPDEITEDDFVKVGEEQ